MHHQNHAFHIPVMGTGHSVDSPIRVAHLGINSVISIVDDLLLERIRKYYSGIHNIPFDSIARNAEDGRAKRVTAYLDMVQDIVNEKFEQLKAQHLFSGSEIDRFFNLLPDTNQLKTKYEELKNKIHLPDLDAAIAELTSRMHPGSIDVNIMAKVDNLSMGKDNKPLSATFSDASAALRGFANSKLESALVISAGFNPRLYGYLADFKDFYRNHTGDIRKKIILKVSDFRSALIQGKFLAKKGLEVSEFRIESGLNCGGHTFASEGHLLPILLKEFKEKKHELAEQFKPLILSFYESMGWEYPLEDTMPEPEITVQGGIGTNGEMQRMLKDYNMDATGWGSPFLLVPEATCVDDPTMELLKNATEDDLYLSRVSPLGVPFNNVRESGSQQWTAEQFEKGKPGSKCPKGFLVSNTEFTEKPICTASSQFQILKIDQIKRKGLSKTEEIEEINKVVQKSCLCEHLGMGALIKLGIVKPTSGKQAICPGPNIAWFNRNYSLDEMVDHIYGRIDSLVPKHRPHMFAKELVMYVDYLETFLKETPLDDKAAMKKLERFKNNLETGIKECHAISEMKPYPDENLTSLKETALLQQERLDTLFEVVYVA